MGWDHRLNKKKQGGNEVAQKVQALPAELGQYNKYKMNNVKEKGGG